MIKYLRAIFTHPIHGTAAVIVIGVIIYLAITNYLI
jgi:hypothetical protein